MTQIQNENHILPPAQISEQGEKIYQERLKSVLEPQERGRFAVIEVESGDYFLGDSILEALNKGRQKYPETIFYTVRVGYPGVFQMGTLAKNSSYGWSS